MKKKVVLNIGCTILCQLMTLISGLIVPRLILSTFGSEANGLVSSLTQFLNYIALVEGGIGSVVLTALYSPLAKNDDRKLSGVLKTAGKFFRQIAYIFIIYTIVLACIYPIIVSSSFSRFFVASLTLILSFNLFIKYFFSITYKLLLQADQKMYIVQLWQALITLLNIVVVVVSIKIFPELRFVKLCGVLLFVIQPIAYSNYVKKHYNIHKDVEPDENSLAQRWACFGQNFAYFIHSNTDVVVLTFFSNLKTVSVYSVYLLVIKTY